MRILGFIRRYQWLLMGIGFLLIVGLGFMLYDGNNYIQEHAKQTASTASGAPTDVSGAQKEKFSKTSKLVKEVWENDPDHFLTFIDSLERVGTISPAYANYKRGDYCYRKEEQLRRSAIYLQKATATDELMKEDKYSYYNALLTLAVVEMNLFDMNAGMLASMKGYEIVSKDTSLMARDMANNFLEKIGCCQLKLGRKEEAAKTLAKTGADAEALARANPNNASIQESVLQIASNINNLYMNEDDFESAEVWVDMMERALQPFARVNASKEKYELYLSEILCNRAIILAMTGHPKEAENYFRDFLATDYAKSQYGIYDIGYYLEVTKQWDRLLPYQLQLDSMESVMSVTPTLDYILRCAVSTYKAWQYTGHKDEALKKANQIFAMLDTVRTSQQKNAADELAVIYETQQKEEQITAQKASLERQRFVTMVIIFGLLTVAFVIFSWFRHRAARRLEQAHQRLLVAYNQLEETTAAKERFESELRIAREIQMSMVPAVFPEREDLDMFASMTPAREVGGDLYDYLLQGSELFFCVGDVSGKGMPASLFMAQTIRLFRALAKRHHSPAEIATILNDELSENNENGMFVTMFIGLLNLDTGQLCFCNAGHNPPVLGGDERGGSFFSTEPNTVIGLWPGMEFEGEEIKSIKGRPLFIYTDGLNEAENHLQEQFGDDRLLEVLRETRFADSRYVIDTLTDAVSKYRQGTEPNDDLTMMCISVK